MRTLCGTILAVSVAATASAAPKKYIAFSWEFGPAITPANVLSNADKFAETPLDGIEIALSGTNSDGERFGTWSPERVGDGPRETRILQDFPRFQPSE